MITLFFRKQIEAEVKRAYDAGVSRGYELGYMMGKMERANRGSIIGSEVKHRIVEGSVNAQIGEILSKMGVKFDKEEL